MEADVAERFKVSRSPVREALQALESEGTLVSTPYAGAMVRPLSPAEIDEIAEIRLSLISLTLKPAHPHLAPAHFDLGHDEELRAAKQKSAPLKLYGQESEAGTWAIAGNVASGGTFLNFTKIKGDLG